MITLAITGGFGTGKTTVAKLFQAVGAELIDIDKIVHDLERPQQRAWKKIVHAFGKKILLPTQQLDRKHLAKIVFSFPAKRKKLNALVHPLVLREMRRKIKLYRQNRHRLIVVDIPLLFEVNEQNRFDCVIVVETAPAIVTKRLKVHRALSTEEIRSRSKSQWPLAKKAALADFVINNNSSKRETRKQVLQIVRLFNYTSR